MKLEANRFAVSTALLLAACGDEGGEEGAQHEEDPGEHACEAFAAGGATALEGGAERDGDAPWIERGERAHEVSLHEDASRYVRLEGPAEGLLFVAAENVVSALYHEADTDDLLPGSEPNEFCPSDIPEHFDLDLAEGDHYLELSASALSKVWLLFTTAEGHAHEE